MRLIDGSLVAMTIFASLSTQSVQAQQRRHVTIHFRQPVATKTQWSPDTQVPSTAAIDVASPQSSSPARLFHFGESSAAPLDSNAPMSASTADIAAFNASKDQESAKPSLQQMQNASGQFKMTFQGFTSGQYQATNTYWGSQFNSWNNLQITSPAQDGFDAFNRTQPSSYTGSYVSPNSYYGASFGAWNNLSTGTIVENPVGGWTYR